MGNHKKVHTKNKLGDNHHVKHHNISHHSLLASVDDKHREAIKRLKAHSAVMGHIKR